LLNCVCAFDDNDDIYDRVVGDIVAEFAIILLLNVVVPVNVLLLA
jgi:hypothetical protein